MEQESELHRLEKFVEKILTRFTALKEEKAQLEQELFERDLLVEELRETISSKVTERNEISDRVNRIVDQIEEWESNLEKGEEVATGNSSPEDPAVVEEEPRSEEPPSELENMEDKSEDDKGRTQQNLFSTAESRE